MKKIVLGGLLIASCLFASEITDEIKQSVQNVIPSTKINKITNAEFDGLYKAYLPNGQILYVEPNKQLIFFGQVWDRNGVNLTAIDSSRWEQEIVSKQIANLSPQTLIENAHKKIFNGGNENYDVVLFTDPDCPFCIKVEEFLKSQKVAVYYNYMPLDQLHPKAREKSLSILGSGKKAKEQLTKMENLAKKLHITGTPKLYIIDKKNNTIAEAINGANIPKLDKYLK